MKMRKSGALRGRIWQGKRRAALLGRRAVSSMPSQWVARSLLLGLPSNTYSVGGHFVRALLSRALLTSPGPKTPEQDDLGFGARSGCTCCTSTKRQLRAAVPDFCGTIRQLINRTCRCCFRSRAGRGCSCLFDQIDLGKWAVQLDCSKAVRVINT